MFGWMDWRKTVFALLAPDDGAESVSAGAEPSVTPAETVETQSEDTGDGNGDAGNEDLAAELAKAKADLLKYKAAMDKAASEASQAKKALRAKQTAEEIAAEEKKAADERAAQEIEELRREVARTKAVKSVMSKLSTNEEVSGKIAEYLYGAEDVDAALAEIQRAWVAREKALKLEYGKITPPGAGGAGGEDEEAMRAIKLAKELGQERAKNTASVQNQLQGLIR